MDQIGSLLKYQDVFKKKNPGDYLVFEGEGGWGGGGGGAAQHHKGIY